MDDQFLFVPQQLPSRRLHPGTWLQSYKAARTRYFLCGYNSAPVHKSDERKE